MAPSPLLRHPLLAEALGADVHVKHENHNPTGAFKVRGGLNLIARLSDADRARGVISATTGNHGQSIAFAAARAGVPCTLVVPVGQQPGEERADARLGRRRSSSTARTSTRRANWSSGCATSAACATCTPPTSPISSAASGRTPSKSSTRSPTSTSCSCPIGGGSGACGLITVRDALGLKTRIVGVGAERASAVARVVAHRHAHRRHVGRHVCRRHRDPGHLRPDVRHPAARARRLRAAERRRTGRRRARWRCA